MSEAEHRQQLREWMEKTRDMRQHMGQRPEGYTYSCMDDFLLQHGQWYELCPIPKGVPLGAQKQCFGNAILHAASRGWKYIEGQALARLSRGGFPVHHAWNVDDKGRLVDSTWMNTGLAYFGVEFSVERADEATWDGDGSILQDWKRRYPIFKKRWTGEDFSTPASRRVKLLREGRIGELYKLLRESEAREERKWT